MYNFVGAKKPPTHTYGANDDENMFVHKLIIHKDMDTFAYIPTVIIAQLHRWF